MAAVRLGCDILFNAEEARLVRRKIEREVGGPCPCMQGKTCPLLAFSQATTPEALGEALRLVG